MKLERGRGWRGCPPNGFPYTQLKRTDKSKIREKQKPKYDLCVYDGFTILRKSENDPKVDTHILV